MKNSHAYDAAFVEYKAAIAAAEAAYHQAYLENEKSTEAAENAAKKVIETKYLT